VRYKKVPLPRRSRKPSPNAQRDRNPQTHRSPQCPPSAGWARPEKSSFRNHSNFRAVCMPIRKPKPARTIAECGGGLAVYKLFPLCACSFNYAFLARRLPHFGDAASFAAGTLPLGFLEIPYS